MTSSSSLKLNFLTKRGRMDSFNRSSTLPTTSRITGITVLLAVLLQCLSGGMVLALPSILNPSILSPNTTDLKATPDQASWLSATIGISGIIGFFTLSSLMEICGRKTVHIIINVVHTLSWIIFCFADSITALFVGRSFQGVGMGAMYINSLIISEYSDPVRRGYFIATKKIAMAVGTLVCHFTALFWTWRQTASFAAISSVFAITLTLIWPESPSYMAMKGRFAECEKSFVWLHGTSLEKKKELVQLISAQTESLKTKRNKKRNKKHVAVALWKTLLQKDFLKALLIAALLTVTIDACGRFHFAAYIIQIMTKLVGNNSYAIFYAIGGDLFALVALFASCLLIRYIKRRCILFVFGLFSVAIMFAISLSIFFKSYFNSIWLTPCLVIVQNFIANLSVIPLSFTIIGEVFPLEHRGLGSFLSGIVFSLCYTVNLKFTPSIMKSLGLEGMFIVYGIILLFCLVILYFVLPETKDRTLQDIEDEMKGIKRTEVEVNTVLMKSIDA